MYDNTKPECLGITWAGRGDSTPPDMVDFGRLARRDGALIVHSLREAARLSRAMIVADGMDPHAAVDADAENRHAFELAGRLGRKLAGIHEPRQPIPGEPDEPGTPGDLATPHKEP